MDYPDPVEAMAVAFPVEPVGIDPIDPNLDHISSGQSDMDILVARVVFDPLEPEVALPEVVFHLGLSVEH